MLQIGAPFRHGLCASVGCGMRCVSVVAIAPRPGTDFARLLATVPPTPETVRITRQRIVLPRDPEKPKRPISAYFRFLADFRAKNTTTNLKGSEIVKQAAVEWKSLTSLQKTPFLMSYEKEKKEFDKVNSEYVTSGKKDAWRRDPEKPKKPMTGFLRFIQDYKKTCAKGLKVTQITKSAGEAWKILPAEQKKLYEDAYAKDKAKYETDMQAYEASGKAAVWKQRVGYDEAAKKAKAKSKGKAQAKTKGKAQARASAKIPAAVASTEVGATLAAKQPATGASNPANVPSAAARAPPQPPPVRGEPTPKKA